jgi:hypothetical protein
MKETNTVIFKPQRHDGDAFTEANPDVVSRTKVWCFLCDVATLLLAFVSMAVLTVVTIVFVVTTMAHTQVAPPTETLHGELVPYYRQSSSKNDPWAHPDMYAFAPVFPASIQDENSMYVQYQDTEPDLSW